MRALKNFEIIKEYLGEKILNEPSVLDLRFWR